MWYVGKSNTHDPHPPPPVENQACDKLIGPDGSDGSLKPKIDNEPSRSVCSKLNMFGCLVVLVEISHKKAARLSQLLIGYF